MRLVEQGLVTLDEDVRPKVPDMYKIQILRGFSNGDHGKPILEINTKPVTLRCVSVYRHAIMLLSSMRIVRILILKNCYE